jgi:amidase
MLAHGTLLLMVSDKTILTQDHPVDKMWAGYSNTIINGKWGWDNLPPTLMGKATNLIRKLRDEYYSALDKYDVLITPTVPFLAPKLPSPDAGIRDVMVNSAGVSLNTSAFNLVSLVNTNYSFNVAYLHRRDYRLSHCP